MSFKSLMSTYPIREILLDLSARFLISIISTTLTSNGLLSRFEATLLPLALVVGLANER